MKQIDEQKLSQALEQKNWEEAKALLKEVFDSPLTESEKGAAYVNLANIYLHVQNNINKQYEEGLDEIISSLKQVNQKEEELTNQIDISATRNQIADL